MQTGYWERRWTGFRLGATPLRIEWDGGEATAVLYDEGVPQAVAGVLKVLPLEVPVIHVAWSGDMLLTVEPIDIGVTEAENHVKNTLPGDLGFDATISEITFTYGVAECHMPTGPHTITIFGQIDSNLPEFAEWARLRRFDGVGQLRLSRID